MSQQSINIGVNPNDGTGDNLRDAMAKVNANFTELYSLTSDNTNVNFTENTIAVTNTNGNLTISPNGVGTLYIDSGAVLNNENQTNSNSRLILKDGSSGNLIYADPFTKSVGINTVGTSQGLALVGNLNVTGTSTTLASNVTLGYNSNSLISFSGSLATDIVPAVTNSYNIGSNSKRINNVYANDVDSLIGNITTLTTGSLTATNINATSTTVGYVAIASSQINSSLNGADLSLTVTGSANVNIVANAIVSGYVKASTLVGGVVRNTLNASVGITTLQSVYSYDPQADGYQVILPNAATYAGATARFINRNNTHSYSVVGLDSTVVSTLSAGASIEITSDGVSWYIV